MPHFSLALQVKHRPARLREPLANLHKSTDAPRIIGQVGAVRFGMSGRAVAYRKRHSSGSRISVSSLRRKAAETTPERRPRGAFIAEKMWFRRRYLPPERSQGVGVSG